MWVEHEDTLNCNSGDDEDIKIEPQVEQNTYNNKTTDINIDAENFAKKQPDGIIVQHNGNTFSHRNTISD